MAQEHAGRPLNRLEGQNPIGAIAPHIADVPGTGEATTRADVRAATRSR